MPLVALERLVVAGVGLQVRALRLRPVDGQPVEVAAAFVFLASAESTYITGERIGVHGGMPLP